MALLKLIKVKGSTLMETMVATVLIVIIFMIASLIMNSLLVAQNKGNTQSVTEHMRELEYKYLNQQLTVPYAEDFENYEILISAREDQGTKLIEIKAQKINSNNQIINFIVSKE